MKKIKLLLLGIVSILGISFSCASFTVSGVTYNDGFYRNQSKGLITFIQSGLIATYQDKNLGATQIYDGTLSSYGTTESFGNYFANQGSYVASPCSVIGNLYQFGNNYGFDCSILKSNSDSIGEVSNLSFVPLTSSHNYEDPISVNGIYVNGGYDVSDVWGGVTKSPESQRGPCPEGYYVPTSGDYTNIRDMLRGYFGSNSNELYRILYLTKFYYFAGTPNPDNIYSFLLSSSFIPNSSSYFKSNGLFRFGFGHGYLGVYYYYGENFAGVFYTEDTSSTGLIYSLAPVRCFKNIPVLPSNSWVSLDGNNDTSILPPDPDSGSNTGQSSWQFPIDGGIFDFNSFLIEKSILCYMSNGTFGGSYGNCEGLNYSGFVDQYEHVSPIWSGNSESGYVGNIVFNNAQSVLSNYCVNTDSIQYQFCSQLDVYSGAYLMYYYENGILDYLILGDGFGVDLGNLGSGQLGNLTCYGAWCSGNINTGLPEYIIPEESGNSFGFSGSYLSADFFNDFVSSGFFFRCPFPYDGSYFTLGKKVIDVLGGRDLLIPINCFIAGYSAGIDSSFFGDPDYGRFWSGSLLSGSSPGHQRLFLLFDIIVSFGLVFFFVKMFNFLFGHG